MRIMPISLKEANEYVFTYHRHHKPCIGQKFSVSVRDDYGLIHGVAICGRPVSRYLDDGLSQNWTGETVWCNPPYGRQMPKWIKKCAEHGKQGGLAVMLIPARTDTKAFHEYIYGKSEIRFVKGRLHFVKENGESTDGAPFPSMVVIFKPK